MDEHVPFDRHFVFVVTEVRLAGRDNAWQS